MHNFGLKFILVGDGRVGKSQLARKFTKNQFNKDSQSTLGMEFSTRAIEFEKSLIKAQLWDTAGQERYESMTKAYYRDAVGAALIFDICNRQSFLNLRNIWMPQVTDYGHESMRLILVGNKLDLIGDEEHGREVAVSEALELARELNIDYIETSALTGHGVENMFRRLVLSVAKLLPEIKIHLELTSLPEGWLIQFNEESATKKLADKESGIESRTNSEKSGSSLSASVMLSGTNPGSKSNHVVPEECSPRSQPSTQPRASIADRMREEFQSKFVYVNYWTGEKQSELPLKPAPTGLLYIAGSQIVKIDDADKEEFQRKSLDDRALTERSSSAKTLDLRNGLEAEPKVRRCRCVIT